ncbi:MAG TPA: hypothetical protein VMV94_01510, partial [Phycisphaerae bacterium]|nr:hypothetical protein [Phycisphaerae bacterium]
MNPLNMLRLWAALLLVPLPALAGGQPADADECLFFSAENIVEGPGNWYCYIEFSAESYTFQKGDTLEYDILMPSSNPLLKGGIDADLREENLPPATSGRPWVRDAGLVDQQGLKLHGDAILTPAENKWYHRAFDLSSLAGCSTVRWNVVFEGDAKGRYAQFLDNIRITRDGQTVLSLYENGPAPAIDLRQTDGYSRSILVTTATRAEAANPEMLPAILKRAQEAEKLREARQRFHSELEVAHRLAELHRDDPLYDHWRSHLGHAAALEKPDLFAGNPEAYLASLENAYQEMKYAQSLTSQFTGHLVGHAHIDLQWLWTWDETINKIIPDTFGQAVRFMEEFPDFTFTQSSAALYLATERYHPELFAKIKKYVAEGRWEIVGGRWCEGDMNMISPESHARHVLYAQRYFQDRFGKTCSVAFEPDTFGHTWQMPQILKKGGMESYYFCRGGKKHPLFWWEAPDGSKILAFEESALGPDAWYTDAINDDKVRELVSFTETTGATDHLMVYGVGNHGGGPTREHIEAGLAMKDRSPWPTIRFSTMTEFFKRLHAAEGKLNIP